MRRKNAQAGDITDSVFEEDRERFATFACRWDAPVPVPDRADFRFVSKNGEIRRCGSLLYPHHPEQPAGLVNIIDNTEWEEYRERVEQTKERRHEIMRAIAHRVEDATPADYGYLNLLLQDPRSFGMTDEAQQILTGCKKRGPRTPDHQPDAGTLSAGRGRKPASITRSFPSGRWPMPSLRTEGMPSRRRLQ